jgi:hypothetical protein
VAHNLSKNVSGSSCARKNRTKSAKRLERKTLGPTPENEDADLELGPASLGLEDLEYESRGIENDPLKSAAKQQLDREPV